MSQVVQDAADRVEWILVKVAIALRGAAFSLLIVQVARRWDLPACVPMVAMSLAVSVRSVTLDIACFMSRRIGVTCAARDSISLATMILLADSALVSGGGPGSGLLYNYATIAAIPVGLAPWPLCATAVAAVALGMANVAGALTIAPDYPLWNALPDSLAISGNVLIAGVVTTFVRRAARQLDRQTGVAIRRARAVAKAREHAYQAEALADQLLATMQMLASDPSAIDPSLREEVRHDARWLHGVINHGLLDDAGGDLSAALHTLAAEKMAAGLEVDIDLPDDLPALTVSRVGALVGAVREALTNVVKHADTRRVRVRVGASATGVMVEVEDHGRGYNSNDRPAGLGHHGSIRQRLAEVGGRATIKSASGLGTRVVLWVPAVSD